jgi:hypothetical protein
VIPNITDITSSPLPNNNENDTDMTDTDCYKHLFSRDHTRLDTDPDYTLRTDIDDTKREQTHRHHDKQTDSATSSARGRTGRGRGGTTRGARGGVPWSGLKGSFHLRDLQIAEEDRRLQGVVNGVPHQGGGSYGEGDEGTEGGDDEGIARYGKSNKGRKRGNVNPYRRQTETVRERKRRTDKQELSEGGIITGLYSIGEESNESKYDLPRPIIIRTGTVPSPKGILSSGEEYDTGFSPDKEWDLSEREEDSEGEEENRQSERQTQRTGRKGKEKENESKKERERQREREKEREHERARKRKKGSRG